jgi:hypothetical protein
MNIVPYLIDGINDDNFLTSHSHVIDVDGVKILTAPLRAHRRIDLIGISSHPSLISGGQIDPTDSIENNVEFQNIYVSVISSSTEVETVKIDTEWMDQSCLVPQGDSKRFSSFQINPHHLEIEAFGKNVKFNLNIQGKVDLMYGTVEVSSTLQDDTGTNMSLLGYDLRAERSNSRTKAA